MSIKLSWDSQAAQGLSAIEIYRKANAPVDDANPGEPLATVAADATSYTDTTAIAGVYYSYRIVSVKDNRRAWSANIVTAYHPDTGPGPKAIMRGNWEYGFFGKIDFSLLVDRGGLINLIPELNTSNLTLTWTAWAKFAYRGKVLYSPQAIGPLSMSYDALNNAGLLFGTDIPSELPSWAKAGVNHKRVINIGDRSYIFRMPRMSTRPLSEYITTYDQSARGEARCLWAPHLRADVMDAAAKPTAVARIGESPTAWSGVLSAHLASPTAVSTINGLEAQAATVALNTAAPSTFVLELIP